MDSIEQVAGEIKPKCHFDTCKNMANLDLGLVEIDYGQHEGYLCDDHYAVITDMKLKVMKELTNDQ